MVNPDLEIDRLRWKLRDREYSHIEADSICERLSREINNVIVQTITNYTAEAIEYAEAIGAHEFLEDIDVIDDGSFFQIRTKSGNTDYSKDRVEMLPRLLKNAKTAKDGSRYKVIPIRDKEKVDTARSTSDIMARISKGQEAMRQELRDKNKPEVRKSTSAANRHSRNAQDVMRMNETNVTRTNRSQQVDLMMSRFSNTIRQSSSEKKRAEIGPPSFRTASSKQSASNNWVIPEKDADMTQFLMNLNYRIANTISASILEIISEYERGYL